MKKGIMLILIIIHLSFLAFPALALAVGQGSISINWTQPVVWIIGLFATILSALLASWWTKTLQPWLEEKNLVEAATIVVNAVEALLGRYAGEDKWRLALEKMRSRGFDIDNDAVIDALKAAWQQLNLSQIAAGIKAPPTEANETKPV